MLQKLALEHPLHCAPERHATATDAPGLSGFPHCTLPNGSFYSGPIKTRPKHKKSHASLIFQRTLFHNNVHTTLTLSGSQWWGGGSCNVGLDRGRGGRGRSSDGSEPGRSQCGAGRRSNLVDHGLRVERSGGFEGFAVTNK
jgi:hypothetical protein